VEQETTNSTDHKIPAELAAEVLSKSGSFELAPVLLHHLQELAVEYPPNIDYTTAALSNAKREGLAGTSWEGVFLQSRVALLYYSMRVTLGELPL